MPDLSARDERHGVDQPHERDELWQWSDLRQRGLREHVRHRGDGLPVRDAQSDQCVPELPAGNEHERMEQSQQQHELWRGE
jgi:hypothetical protein